MPGPIVAVDGGNSKTDVALMSAEGELLSWVRGPGCALGAPRAAALVTLLAVNAARKAGLPPDGLVEAHAACYLAGADLPMQAAALREAIAGHRVVSSVEVGNDAWALLRLGAPAPAPAVAVVCGAGLKCVARAAGERYEFPGLGWQTGDLSGGGDFLVREAIRMAARAEDGRGAGTRLGQLFCQRLGAPTIHAVGERMAAGTLAESRLLALAPAVLDCAAGGDAVAASIVDALAAEVAALAYAARGRFTAARSAWTLVLGGGLFADGERRLLAAVHGAAPRLSLDFAVTTPVEPPVAGAALLGYEHLRLASAEDLVRQAFVRARPTVFDAAEVL